MWISVTKKKNPELVFIGPHRHNKRAYHQYEMQMFGIRWSLFVGGQIEPLARRMCTLRSPERFIYVSCGLASFRDDTARLTAPGKLRLSALTAFDLLPYTEHVETVACFERSAGAPPASEIPMG